MCSCHCRLILFFSFLLLSCLLFCHFLFPFFLLPLPLLSSGVLGGSTGKVDTVVTMLLQYNRKLPSWLNFVATSRPDESTKKELDPLSGAKIDVKDENNLEDIQCYVRSKIAGGGAAADQDDVVNKICERAAGVFMFASEVVRQYMEDESLDLDKLPEGLAELYMDRYKRTFKEDVSLVAFHEHSAPMLAMLMSSRGPLPREMVRVARRGGGGGEGGGEGGDDGERGNETGVSTTNFLHGNVPGSVVIAPVRALSFFFFLFFFLFLTFFFLQPSVHTHDTRKLLQPQQQQQQTGASS